MACAWPAPAFDPGTIVVMDRGYTDYAWFGSLTVRRGGSSRA